MMWNDGFGAWWMFIPGLLVPLLIIAGIVALVAYTISAGRRTTHEPREKTAPDSSRRILEDRLARGEISVEQFRSLIDAIDQSRT